ncbi:jg14022 [Pararge aegeria aegeria]|uniref:Jg14022 protein n=1 Tax=Pararge aegeria aegeria TaxID=348720 RepID=A0A8S4R7W8_9NEOP|nr:jg14022 [Pararge aegeria aegeria]
MEDPSKKYKTSESRNRKGTSAQCFNPAIFQSCANEKLVSKKKTPPAFPAPSNRKCRKSNVFHGGGATPAVAEPFE